MLFLIVAANLDNFGVGLSLGARRIRVPLSSNLLIALTTSLGTLCTLFTGSWLVRFFSVVTAKHLGAAVIAGMGIWVLYQELFEARKRAPAKPPEKKEPAALFEKNVFHGFKNLLTSPALADTDYSGHIDVKEALFLGGALTLNNFAGGFGAGILGLNPVLTACGMAVFSLLLLWAGVKLGQNSLSRWLGGLARPAAGFLLVLLGVCGMLV
jgi:putative sporulation protein YtaF